MAAGTVVTVCVAGGAIWLFGADRASSTKSRKVACYQDSMHPWIKSEQPGKCTICAMDLTPIYEGEKEFGAEDGLVVLNSNSITVLNVQTELVERQPLALTLRVAGTLDADETRKVIFSAPASGRIHEMVVGAVGDEVEATKPLLTFYSPELATWRRAYVVRSRTATTATPLFAGRQHEPADGRERPMSGSTPAPGAATATPAEPDPYFSDLLSPLSGTVVERKVFNGQYVAEGDRLLTIVDTSVLWFRFDVYEHQLSWLHKGQKIQVRVAALPGREFSGVIAVIEPTLDETTRTVKVRANIANATVGDGERKDRLLRLGMYAEASVQAEMPGVLTVPRSAVLAPGERAYVYVEESAGVYAMRAVKLGRQGNGHCEVLEGVEEGDRVVTTGNVLIDAQAQFTLPPKRDAADMAGTPRKTGSSMPSNIPEKPVGREKAPDVAQPSPVPTALLTARQTQALEDFLAVAATVSEALAADSLRDFQAATARLKGAVIPLGKEFGESHPWHTAVHSAAVASAWPEAKDLAGARAAFLPFSTKVVELVELARTERTELRSLRVYYCPMAPKPGLWYQSKAPLRNPFFGAEMLSCGKEILRNSQPAAIASRPEPAPAEPLPAAEPAATIRTTNNRHPEAKERMARAFGVGIAERHRIASRAPLPEGVPSSGESTHKPTP